MEYLGLYNKPKAAVHPECKLMGPKKEEEERKKQKFPLVNHFLYNFFFDLLLTVLHLSIFFSVINQLDAQNSCFTIGLFHTSTCFKHYVLIIRRSKLHYTASGIITPIGGCLVQRLREDWFCLNLCTRQPPIGVMIPEAV